MIADFLEYSVRPWALRYLRLPLEFYFQRFIFWEQDLRTWLHASVLHSEAGNELQSPSALMFEVSNICNARCCFCAYRLMNYKKEVMTFELFKQALDQYKALGGNRIIMTATAGENLCDPGFFMKVCYAKDRGFSILMFGNGVALLNNDNWRRMVDSRIDEVVISTGDFIPDLEAEQLGITHEQAKRKLEGLRKYVTYNFEQGMKNDVMLGFRSSRSFNALWQTMKDTPFMWLYQQKAFKVRVLQSFDNWSSRITEKDMKGIMKLKQGNSVKRYPCHRIYATSILPNGDVRLCSCRMKESTHDELVIGNLNDNSFKEIIEGEVGKRVIGDWKAGKVPPICSDCNFYTPCFVKNPR